MSNVDYVYVDAPTAEVMDAVKTATGVTQLVDGDTLVNGDDRTALTVAPTSDPGHQSVVDVYYGGDLADRRAISQRLYDHIVDNTDWDVRLNSDDAQDVIAARISQR